MTTHTPDHTPGPMAGRPVFVPGLPMPQGSKRAMRHRSSGKLILLDDNAGLKVWRQAVTAAWACEGLPMVVGPVGVCLVFVMPRPAGHWGTGSRAGVLRPSAPEWPAVKPDVDKLVRAMLDGLTEGGAFEDDARVVQLQVLERYQQHRGELTGVWATVGPPVPVPLGWGEGGE